MASEYRLDLDREPLELVEDAYSISRDAQQVRNNQYSRDYKLFHNFINMMDRDPDRANIFIPKIYSIVETTTPRDVKALVGKRPYIPFDANRPEYRKSSKRQTEMLDWHLDKGGFFEKMVSATKIKRLYGTSFMEALPYREVVNQKVLQTEQIMGIPIGQKIVEQPVERLRFKLRELAPWEVYVDPFATNLEEKGACHYVVKIMLVRKSQILDMYNAGAYPGMNTEAFEMNEGSKSATTGDHWGLQMMNDLGITSSNVDEGVGILMRFESEKRYIDLWNGRIVLRDIPNPFKHGMINLSRQINTMEAHSQNKFWGIGEAKPNEILQHMLNDSWNLTFDAHNMNNHGMIYYRKGEINPDSLVRTVGNRVGIESDSDKPVRDLVHESFGQALPQDHYAIPNSVERMMDLGSGVFNEQRGEQSAGDSTATESAIRKEYGDSRQELAIRMGEMIFLKSFGEKMLSMVEQFATPADIVEILGIEGSQELIGLNPADLPGGYNFTFRGSDRLANLLMKQRNWKELIPLMLQIPNVLTGKLAKTVLEVFEEDDRSSEEMIIPDEIMMQMQQQAAQQEKVDIELQEQRNHERALELAEVNAKKSEQKSGNKLKDNNRKTKTKGGQHSKNQPNHDTKSEAQNQARQTRGN